MSFHGQFKEESFINTIFPDKTNGICVDVGAYDGISLSNTLYYENKGWRALCIEPIPQAFQKCKKIRNECYQCCIGEFDSDDIDFTIFHLNDNLCAISSLIPDERLIKSHKHLITNISKTKVKVRSLTSLLDELSFPLNIDFISIDTENTELDVLRGFNINKYNVKLFVIENNFNELYCEKYLEPYGYKKINRIGVNDFYLKEQIVIPKNWVLTHCQIKIQNEEVLYDKLSEINYLCGQYDIITFDTNLITIISNIFKQTNIVYDNTKTDFTIDLHNYCISLELKNQYEFEPISYISGGKLGDLIHNLSVINENFYKTGRKGILYIENIGDNFHNGLEYTYNDTYEIISKQKYIKTYKIRDDEPFQNDLNYWRKNPGVYYQNFCDTYTQTYNVNWGKHKWLDIPEIDYSLCDKVLINISEERFKNIDYNRLITECGEDNVLFVCVDKNQHTHFVKRTNLNIQCLHVTTFTDLCIAINSCKLFIGSQSMPLALANALFKDSIIITTTNIDCKLHNDFDLVFENVKSIL